MKAWMATVPVGLLALIATVADKGERLIQILTLLQAWTARLPMGLWSFLLSLGLALLVWATALTKLTTRQGTKPHFSADTLALAAALFVTLGQQLTVAAGQGAILQAVISGLISGLLAPFVGRGIRAAMASRNGS